MEKKKPKCGFALAKTLESLSAVGHYDELMESQHGLCSPCYARNSSTCVSSSTTSTTCTNAGIQYYWAITCRIQARLLLFRYDDATTLKVNWRKKQAKVYCIIQHLARTDDLFSLSFFSVRPQTVTISPPTEPFSVSRLAVLECRSSGSRPPATITWWKRGKFMGKASEEVTWKTLVLAPVFVRFSVVWLLAWWIFDPYLKWLNGGNVSFFRCRLVLKKF